MIFIKKRNYNKKLSDKGGVVISLSDYLKQKKNQN